MTATHSESAAFADVAARLAHDIAGSAIWWQGRCNWIGSQAPASARRHGGHASRAALDATLYDGTSGIALFLAAAAAQLDDAALRVAALGAIRHALDHAPEIEPDATDGLYAGTIGIAYAAVTVSRLLDEPAILDGAGAALGAWRARPPTAPGACDLMRGRAGAIVGLLAMSDAIEDGSLVEEAVGLGEQLVARANVAAAGWSWPPSPSEVGLCGFSHGAAGIGLALLELFAVTGDGRFRRAATGAFAYERAWLEHRDGTWPDLHGVGPRAGWRAPPSAAGTWCNGAPGIALSRLRAQQLLAADADLERDGTAALAMTSSAAARLAAGSVSDFSLCHGAAGIGDVLLEAADRDGACALGLLGLASPQDSPSRFGCGVIGGGSTPGLMLGLAGIGNFYLRLAGCGSVTPLLVRRQSRLPNRPYAQ